MALENSVIAARPDSLSLPVEEKGDAEGEEVEASAEAGAFDLSEEPGPVVASADPAQPPPPLAKVRKSFQNKLLEREAKANEPRKKTQGTEKERGRFGWGERRTSFSLPINVCSERCGACD